MVLSNAKRNVVEIMEAYAMAHCMPISYHFHSTQRDAERCRAIQYLPSVNWTRRCLLRDVILARVGASKDTVATLSFWVRIYGRHDEGGVRITVFGYDMRIHERTIDGGVAASIG
jgi:hypothetical protein